MGIFRQLAEQCIKEIEEEYTRQQKIENCIYDDIGIAELIYNSGDYTYRGIVKSGGDPEEFWGMPCRTPEYIEVEDLDIDETKIPQLIEEELSKLHWELTDEDKQTIKDVCASEKFQKYMDKIYDDLQDIIIEEAEKDENDNYDY